MNTPAAAAVVSTPRSRAGVVTPLTVRRKTQRPTPNRPTMWTAFTRFVGAATAATNITDRSTSHGRVREVRQTGVVRVQTRVATQADKTQTSAASTLVTRWPGNSTSGSKSSKGATNSSAHTPSHAVVKTSAGARVCDARTPASGGESAAAAADSFIQRGSCPHDRREASVVLVASNSHQPPAGRGPDTTRITEFTGFMRFTRWRETAAPGDPPAGSVP